MVNGKRVQRSTRTGDLKTAKAIHHIILGEMLLDNQGLTKKAAPTLKEAFESAMRSHFGRTKSASTVATNFKTLARILRKLALLSKTLKLNRDSLQSVTKVPLQKEYRGRIKYPSETDEKALYEAIEQRMRDNRPTTFWPLDSHF
jgi:DNA-directed RNA polymerase subunit M/transcription elongation factor TFIIS